MVAKAVKLEFLKFRRYRPFWIILGLFILAFFAVGFSVKAIVDFFIRENEDNIARFLEKNPSGGMHHVCYEVEDIEHAADKLVQDGLRILGDGKPKIGAHNKPVLFLHPKDGMGTLIELEQV